MLAPSILDVHIGTTQLTASLTPHTLQNSEHAQSTDIVYADVALTTAAS
jgi:hypothetical protein